MRIPSMDDEITIAGFAGKIVEQKLGFRFSPPCMDRTEVLVPGER
jgi:hypothetical protein